MDGGFLGWWKPRPAGSCCWGVCATVVCSSEGHCGRVPEPVRPAQANQHDHSRRPAAVPACPDPGLRLLRFYPGLCSLQRGHIWMSYVCKAASRICIAGCLGARHTGVLSFSRGALPLPFMFSSPGSSASRPFVIRTAYPGEVSRWRGRSWGGEGALPPGRQFASARGCGRLPRAKVSECPGLAAVALWRGDSQIYLDF